MGKNSHYPLAAFISISIVLFAFLFSRVIEEPPEGMGEYFETIEITSAEKSTTANGLIVNFHVRGATERFQNNVEEIEIFLNNGETFTLKTQTTNLYRFQTDSITDQIIIERVSFQDNQLGTVSFEINEIINTE